MVVVRQDGPRGREWSAGTYGRVQGAQMVREQDTTGRVQGHTPARVQKLKGDTV